METVEVTFLSKNYFYQSDEPEAFEEMCQQLAEELDLLRDMYPSFSREQLLLLYILRHQENSSQKREHPIPPAPDKKEEIEDEQLGVNLDDIDDILNTDI
ncbi:MAG: hypothetical protein K9M99_05885 [Candidatus Cloacimonetes bacterium]|nr:hypothetical protein [Candidatus Cloacimonadota bacterium]